VQAGLLAPLALLLCHSWYPCLSSTCAPSASHAGFDCLLGGRGSIDWRLWGWLPALAASGPLLDQSMLVRWLAGEWGG
jgi:hypothetical protein